MYNNRRLVEGTPCLRINLSNYNERNKLQHPNATATGRTKDGRLTLSCRPQRQGDGVRGERALPHSNTTLETTQGGEIEAIAAWMLEETTTPLKKERSITYRAVTLWTLVL